MKRILVLGKSGYISTCFQTYMKKYPNYEVEAITVRGEKWKSLCFKEYDAIVNTVGLAHNNARKGSNEQFTYLNVHLPVELANKAKADGVSLFVHMSSMIVYGSMSPLGLNKKCTADTIPTPTNIYGRSKLMGEQALTKIQSQQFNIAIIRSSLVYGENAIDNFKKLVDYAGKLPVFPNIQNERSMIYADNLCELIRLIIDNNSKGLFYPQQEQYICTSKIVKDIAKAIGHRILLTKVFNPVLKLLSGNVSIVDKVFGSETYELNMSNAFDGKYRVVNYRESIRRIANARTKNGYETMFGVCVRRSF